MRCEKLAVLKWRLSKISYCGRVDALKKQLSLKGRGSENATYSVRYCPTVLCVTKESNKLCDMTLSTNKPTRESFHNIRS